jgi:hypothetical protein
VPYDEEMVEWNISERSVFEFSDETIKNEIAEIFDNIKG